MITKLTFPYPPSELNPNRRLHWAKKVRVKNQQKDLGFALASRWKNEFTDAKTIAITLTFHSKTKRHYDLDNATASLKAALDGIAKGLDVNDKFFSPITIYRGEPDKNHPRVEITLEKTI